MWWKTTGVLGRLYPTKKSLESAIREIVATYPLETPVSEDHKSFLIDVLKHHAEWSEKSAGGVRDIVCRRYTAWSGSTVGLALLNQDGTEVDISWVYALKPNGKVSEKERVAAAARFEIVGQRNAAAFGVPDGAPCPICGHPLLKGDRHVDHAPPKTFDTILSDFVTLFVGDWEAIRTVPNDEVHERFADHTLADAWQSFHANEATLRVIHKHENLGAKR